MADKPKGKRIAFAMATGDVEQVELTQPLEAVRDTTGSPEPLAPDAWNVHAFNNLDTAGVNA